MSAPNLGVALLASFDGQALAQLAERLRPYLEDQPHHQPLLTPAQAAERLRLHPKTVVRMARDGRLPAIKIGTGWRFHPEQIAVEPRRPTQSVRASRSRPRACPGGVPASVQAIRGGIATSERGGR